MVVMGCLLYGSPAARAGVPPVNCGPAGQWDGSTCRIMVTNPGQGGGSGLGGSGGTGSPRTCLYAGISMPCQDPALGWWSDSRYCYVKLTSPQPCLLYTSPSPR